MNDAVPGILLSLVSTDHAAFAGRRTFASVLLHPSDGVFAVLEADCDGGCLGIEVLDSVTIRTLSMALRSLTPPRVGALGIAVACPLGGRKDLVSLVADSDLFRARFWILSIRILWLSRDRIPKLNGSLVPTLS